jgi:hypothetical protein
LTARLRKPSSLLRRLRGRIYGDVSLCLLIMIGCTNGDFGRVRPSLVTDGIHAWVGRDAARADGAPVSQFPLTDDEMLMRDYAYQLIQPAYDRNRWYSVLGEWGMTHYFKPEWYLCDPTAYAARLMNAIVRSETSRYSRLDDDVRNDVIRIGNFFPVARRVLDIDEKRGKSLSYIPVLSGAEIENTKARISENLLIVAWVQRSLEDRIASYRFALERLMLAAPSVFAVEVERSISYLQIRATEAVLVEPPPNFMVTAAAPALGPAVAPALGPVPMPPQRPVVSK